MSALENKKVYQGVIQQIRKFIEQNNLNPGDRLPSERELSDSLQAGRSSVREALRALELLGIIETRPGEGTYLSGYRPFQTVELLASFILQEEQIRDDISDLKKILEKEAAKLVFSKINEQDIQKLKEIIDQPFDDPNARHVVFFNSLFDLTENMLLMRIWQLLEEFSHTIDKKPFELEFYNHLIDIYREGNTGQIEKLFSSNLSY